jgi:Tfp pilus assembly protein PilO
MKNIISIIIIIVVSLASFILVVKPEYMKIKEYQTKSDELNQVLDNARKLQFLRDGLLKKQKELSQADLARLEKLIPESVDNVKLIIEFQKIAERYGLNIQTASTIKDDAIGDNAGQNFDISTRDYGTITLDFNVVGGYDEFLFFLADIEDNLRITDLRSLSMSEGEAGNYSFDLSVETYWLKDNI